MSILQTSHNDYNLGLQESAESVETPLRFVLVETSRPGNIGAAARAMKTMGHSQLVLVRPRSSAPAQEAEAIAFASGALDVLQAARIVASMEEALDGCNHVAAVSARLREFSPPVNTPRLWAQQLANAIKSGGNCRAALVFGNERFGLPNNVVQQCDVLINIPANPAYSSLNLAQAVQILSYECALFQNFIAEASPMFEEKGDAKVGAVGKIGFTGQAADRTQIDAMFCHLEQALTAIGFLDPDHPKKLMSRMRRLFARTALEIEEVNILRGIARQILKTGK